MKPLERGLLDKIFNGKLLGKRKINKPFRHYADTPQRHDGSRLNYLILDSIRLFSFLRTNLNN
jgi:hypothetical protein